MQRPCNNRILSQHGPLRFDHEDHNYVATVGLASSNVAELEAPLPLEGGRYNFLRAVLDVHVNLNCLQPEHNRLEHDVVDVAQRVNPDLEVPLEIWE